MTGSDLAAVPLSLSHLPTAGGLAVPWITARAEGRYLFGAIDRDAAHTALLQRLCGVCGRALGDRLVLFLRLSDLSRQRTNEPAVDPACAAYTARACPMVNGRLGHYRTTALRLDPTTTQSGQSSARRGAPAEPWFAVWLTAYDVVVDHGTLAASYAGRRPLRIRPVRQPGLSAPVGPDA